MKALDEIVKTDKELQAKGYKIENSMIESVDVNCIAHFGNAVSFEIFCVNAIPYSCINNTLNVGYVIKAFVELMDLERDDGIRLSEIKNIPCRIVQISGRVVGIGHFMKNRFVLTEDLQKIVENMNCERQQI